MNYWVFVKSFGDSELNLKEDAKLLKKHALNGWDLGERTANRENLFSGDRVVFYVSGQKNHLFVGTATVAALPKAVSKIEFKKRFMDPLVVCGDYYVKLEDVDVWSTPKPLSPMLPHLSFIKNKVYYGNYLMGGIRRISKADFEYISKHESKSHE